MLTEHINRTEFPFTGTSLNDTNGGQIHFTFFAVNGAGNGKKRHLSFYPTEASFVLVAPFLLYFNNCAYYTAICSWALGYTIRIVL